MKEDFPDYDSAVRIIVTLRAMRRWAFLVFLVPGLAWGLAFIFNPSNELVLVLLAVLLPITIHLFMRLRVPTPRIKWKDDFRSPLLLLRSFEDERLKMGDIVSAPDPIPAGEICDNFLLQIPIALWDAGRVVVIQTEADSVSEIFGIVVQSSETQWREDVEHVARGAWAVLLFPSTSPGVVEEMLLLRKTGLLYKTILFMPPSARELLGFRRPFDLQVEYAPRWDEIRTKLRQYEIELPPYNAQGMFFVPNEHFGIERSVALNHHTYPWRRMLELLDPSRGQSLIDCLPVDRSRES